MASSYPEHEPLRDDVRFLGALLGEVLTEQGGEALFSIVERARLAARRRRAGDPEAAAELDVLLGALAPPEAEAVARAFSSYFNLVNMAERVHRIRRRRDYLQDPETPQPGSLADVFRRLARSGVSLGEVTSALARTEVIPVFTAHPTEAVRRTILAKAQRVARLLIERFATGVMTPVERRAGEARLRHEITLTWQTDEHLHARPSVADEVEHVLFYLVEVVYRVVPPFYDLLAEALELAYGEGAGTEVPCPVVRFASWVGGDMDGNPNVSGDTIRSTLARQRELILARYLRELRTLFDHLSQSASRIGVSRHVEERIAALADRLPGAVAAIPDRYRDMRYRVLVWLMSESLKAAVERRPGGYQDASELASDLATVDESLLDHRGRYAGHALVQRLRRRVATFGFHLATLDVRQHAGVHRGAIGELLGDPEFASRPAQRRFELLRRMLHQGHPSRQGTTPATTRTLDVFKAIGEAQREHGPDAVGPFIVSMAEGADDVLAVLVLARAAGLADAGGTVPLDVAPLFETVEDLQRAGHSLAELLSGPDYRTHLEARGRLQTVMLGYSDSSKGSGLAASRWALYTAQRELLAAANGAGVELRVFHGRGGTASRGGSKPREAVLAEPPGTVRGRFRVTEQGEIIHAKYGLRDIALRTLELVTAAVVEVTAVPEVAVVPVKEWGEAMTALARASRQAFRSLVYDDPDFLAYFRAATPIDVIERMPIGSRPPSRKPGAAISDLRAIPWTFAWVQSRHILPGWYGVGTGLESAAAESSFELITTMAARWPFFANLLGDVAMVLGKADLEIAERYAALAGEAGRRIFPRIAAEFERTQAAVCRALGTATVLEREPTLATAIRLRNPYVDPISLLQLDLLRRWRGGGRRDADLERALFTTVRGIARGMQNTG